jgi:glycosyltransferase involved in cell wall biosynthesis
MKIVYLVSTLKRSGPINQLLNLIKHIDMDFFEVFLVTLSPETSDSRWSDFEKLGVEIISINLTRLQGIFCATRALKKKLQSIKPDLIHTQGLRPDFLVARLRLGIPKICTVHSCLRNDYIYRFGVLVGTVVAILHLRAISKFSKIVPVSKSVEKFLQVSNSFKNQVTIRNGVDTDFFSPADKATKLQLRLRLSLPENCRIWISTGHLSDLKNPLLLINAWKRCFSNNIEEYLLASQCQDMIRNVSNIHMCGRVKNVAEFLRASDIFISTSNVEGMPMAVLEAMSCGLKLVLSNIAAHKEIWKIYPRICKLFESGNLESLEKIIKEIEKERFSELPFNEHFDLIRSEVSASKMSQNYQRLYKSFFL